MRGAAVQDIRAAADAILQDNDHALSQRDVHLGEDEAATATVLSYPRSRRPPSLAHTTTIMSRMRTGFGLLAEAERQPQADEAADQTVA